MLSCTCATCLSRDCGSAAGCLFLKTRSCRPPRIIDEGLAGRFVAERVSLVGTMGRLPVIMRPLRKALGLNAVGAECPVPKCFAGRVVIALRICASVVASHTFEKCTPPYSGAT